LISVGLSSLTKYSEFKIYPNPNNGNFTIEIIESREEISLEIYNQVGQIMYKKELNHSSNQINLNVDNGVYLIKVLNRENIYNQRIIVNR